MESLPGFRNFYPDPVPTGEHWSARLRRHILDTWSGAARGAGFQEYDGPPLEPLSLYTAKSGDEIVAQLYNFTDKGEREVALRPEMTPTVARMIAARARAYKKPIKWFSCPQLFRYERQQKGRLREHYQFNADIFGESDPAADAELISLLIESLRAFGLGREDFVVRLSSRQAWQGFFREHGGHSGQEYDFYQAIDKLGREPEDVTAGKLVAAGVTLDAVRGFMEAAAPTPDLAPIVEDLRHRGLEAFVRVDYGVIRGLAYYTGPVFEAFDRKGEFRAIAGGGRYDHLVSLLSGGKVDLPALGFGMGDVVLAELLKARNCVPGTGDTLDAYVLVEAENQRPAALALVQALRHKGCRVDFPLTATKPDKQFKKALELGARFLLRWEGETPASGVVAKDLGSRQESSHAPEDLPAWLLAGGSRG